MSKYTTEVRYICEMAAGSTGEMSVTEVINKSWMHIFDFDFPILIVLLSTNDSIVKY